MPELNQYQEKEEDLDKQIEKVMEKFKGEEAESPYQYTEDLKNLIYSKGSPTDKRILLNLLEDISRLGDNMQKGEVMLLIKDYLEKNLKDGKINTYYLLTCQDTFEEIMKIKDSYGRDKLLGEFSEILNENKSLKKMEELKNKARSVIIKE